MEFEEFKIGEFFWTGSGRWLCIDKGQWSLVACLAPLGIDKHKLTTSSESWHEIHEEVFYFYDFGGCRLTDEFSEI